MIKAIVADDEILTLEHICRLLEREGVEVLGYYSDPYQMLSAVETLRPDVLFLDIEMPEISGLELAEKAQASGFEGEIVFITAYNQYAINAFDVNALDYLLKPVSINDLDRAVERVRKRMTADKKITGAVPAAVRVSLFGRVLLYTGQKNEPVHWLTAKCAEVFAYLLLQGESREVSKWKLMEAVWGDSDSEKAHINLRSTLSRLNKILRENRTGIAVVSVGSGYRIDIGGTKIDIDALELEKLILDSIEINSQNSEHYGKILLSCTDAFLEEFDSPWCYQVRMTYHRYLAAAGARFVKYLEAAKAEPLKILKIIELMNTHEPYNEGMRMKAVAILFHTAGKKEAEKYYNEYLTLLKKDLGVRPGQELQQLYRKLTDELSDEHG